MKQFHKEEMKSESSRPLMATEEDTAVVAVAAVSMAEEDVNLTSVAVAAVSMAEAAVSMAEEEVNLTKKPSKKPSGSISLRSLMARSTRRMSVESTTSTKESSTARPLAAGSAGPPKPKPKRYWLPCCKEVDADPNERRKHLVFPTESTGSCSVQDPMSISGSTSYTLAAASVSTSAAVDMSISTPRAVSISGASPMSISGGYSVSGSSMSVSATATDRMSISVSGSSMSVSATDRVSGASPMSISGGYSVSGSSMSVSAATDRMSISVSGSSMSVSDGGAPMAVAAPGGGATAAPAAAEKGKGEGHGLRSSLFD